MLTAVEKQSAEIAQGVHLGRHDDEMGAGDQVSLGALIRRDMLKITLKIDVFVCINICFLGCPTRAKCGAFVH